MSFKDSFKKNLENKDNLDKIRYESSKSIFICVSFLFFLLFFLSGAGYYSDFSLSFISPFYIMLIFSLDLYLFYFIKLNFKKINFKYKKVVFYAIISIIFIISILSLYIII